MDVNQFYIKINVPDCVFFTPFKTELEAEWININTSSANSTESDFTLTHLINLMLPHLKRRVFDLSRFVLKKFYIDNQIPLNNHLDKKQIKELSISYPILFKRIKRLFKDWFSNCVKIHHRWHNDELLIKNLLDEKEALTAPESIEIKDADPHNGAQFTLVFRLKNNRRIVYKPVPVKNFELLADVATCLDLKFKVSPTVIDKDQYGWVEFIEHRPVKETAGAAKYYNNLGQLTALLKLLNADDMHSGNIIASGEYPVVIDSETIGHLRYEGHQNSSPLKSASRVLEMGIIPHPVLDKSLQHYSAITVCDGAKDECPLSVPFDNSIAIGIDKYIRQFTNGFEQTLLKACKPENQTRLLNLISSVQRTPARIILRNTGIYSRLLRGSVAPESYTSSRAFNKISQGLNIDTQERPLLSKIIGFEKQAIFRGDIPYFQQDFVSSDLKYNDKCLIKSLFHSDGKNTILDNIKMLTKQNVKNDIKLIKAAFDVSRCNAPKKSDYSALLKVTNATPWITLNSYLASQTCIQNELLFWPLLDGDNVYGKTIDLFNYDIYNGQMGVLFWIAIAYKLFPESFQNSSVTNRNIENSLKHYADINKINEDNIGFNGFGGYLYILGICKHYFNYNIDEELTRSIINAIETKSKLRFPVDVLSGLPGALLSAVTCWQLSGDQIYANLSATLADRLLKTLPSNDKMLCGFAHGISGIAQSLFKFGSIFQQQKFTNKALEMLEYESQLYCYTHQNWPDKRMPPDDQLGVNRINAWCHGALGIGLSRQICKKYSNMTKPSFFDNDIINATNAVRVNQNKNNISLCHGMSAQLAYSHNEFNRFKRLNVQSTLKSIQNKIQGKQRLDLMLGLSGLAIELMRLALPDKVPNFLMMEPPAKPNL